MLLEQGQIDEAMVLLTEQREICKKLADVEGLAYSLANSAQALKRAERAREALPLAEEAQRLASSHGYAALARQFEPMLTAVREAAQRE